VKAIGVIIVFPVLSVMILSLYVAGGASRYAAIALLVGSVLAIAIMLLRKRNPSTDRTESGPPAH
jgi:hypothetical protein